MTDVPVALRPPYMHVADIQVLLRVSPTSVSIVQSFINVWGVFFQVMRVQKTSYAKLLTLFIERLRLWGWSPDFFFSGFFFPIV